MRILAVIPARQNSTRVPDKNTMRLGPDAKPNLVRTIEAVKECDQIEVVAVITDDPKAAKLALLNDCRALQEPPHVAKYGDLYDVMDFAVRNIDGPWDAVILAYANVPIRPSGLFTKILEILQATEVDSVAALCPERGHMGGSIFRWDYLEAVIVSRDAIDLTTVELLYYEQDEIVEIDELEDVTWTNTLLNAKHHAERPLGSR